MILIIFSFAGWRIHTPLAVILTLSMSTQPRCQEGCILQNNPMYLGKNDQKVPINPPGLSILSNPPHILRYCPQLSPLQLLCQTANCFAKQLSSWMQHCLERVTGQ